MKKTWGQKSRATVPLRYIWVRFLGFNWSGQMNPSALLINPVEYFWFWFLINLGWFHEFAEYAQFCLHIQWTNAVSSAYSKNMHSFILCIRWIQTGFMFSCLFCEYAEFHSAYSMKAHCLYKSVRFFLPQLPVTFKRQCFNKQYECVRQDSRLAKNN